MEEPDLAGSLTRKLFIPSAPSISFTSDSPRQVRIEDIVSSSTKGEKFFSVHD